MKSVVLIVGAAFLAIAVWKFISAQWRSDWRTRRSDASNNWQNEGFMANQDGKSWSDIDGTAQSSKPPQSLVTGQGTFNA